jgi:DNA-binding transcriptional MerR regulator
MDGDSVEKQWISASEVAKQSGVPESTTRRYLSSFEKFFKYQERNRGKRYHPDAVVIVTRIQSLYSAGAESEEVEKALLNEFPFTIDSHDPTTELPPAVAPYATSEDIAKIVEKLNQQEEFNKALLEQLEKRDRHIEQLLNKRDESLMIALREIQEAKLLVAAEEDKKMWWEFWKK